MSGSGCEPVNVHTDRAGFTSLAQQLDALLFALKLEVAVPWLVDK